MRGKRGERKGKEGTSVWVDSGMDKKRGMREWVKERERRKMMKEGERGEGGMDDGEKRVKERERKERKGKRRREGR